MPIALHNIRSSGTMNLFTVNWEIGGNSGSGRYRLKPNLYPTISSLINSEINNAKANIAITSSNPCTMTFTTTTGSYGFEKIKLTHNASSFTINDSYFMNNILGFSSGTYTTADIYGTTPINLFPDTHLYMYISNVQSNNNNNKQVTFKIPLGSYKEPPSYTHYEETNEQQQITMINSVMLYRIFKLVI